MPNAECLVVVAIDPDDTLLNAFFGIEIEDFRIVFSDLSARKREDIIFDVCHILMPLQIVDAAFSIFQNDSKPLLLASVDAIAVFQWNLGDVILGREGAVGVDGIGDCRILSNGW